METLIDRTTFNDEYLSRLSDLKTGTPIADMLAAQPEIADFVANSELGLESEARAVTVAGHVIRSCIKYDVNTPIRWDQAPEGLGYCFHYSFVLSAVSRAMGLSPKVALCNEHAMTALVSRDRTALHLVNADDLPHMWLFDIDNHPTLNGVISSAAAGSIIEQPTSKPITVSLDTPRLRAYVDLRRLDSDNSAISSKAWMSPKRPQPMTVMPLAYATRALLNLDNLTQALHSQEINGTTQALRALNSYSPTIETNPKYNSQLKTFSIAVAQWCQDPNVGSSDIHTAIELYESSLPGNKMKYMTFGDIWKKVGRLRKDSQALAKAEDSYLEAKNLGRLDTTLYGKLRSITALKAELANA